MAKATCGSARATASFGSSDKSGKASFGPWRRLAASKSARATSLRRARASALNSPRRVCGASAGAAASAWASESSGPAWCAARKRTLSDGCTSARAIGSDSRPAAARSSAKHTSSASPSSSFATSFLSSIDPASAAPSCPSLRRRPG